MGARVVRVVVVTGTIAAVVDGFCVGSATGLKVFLVSSTQLLCGPGYFLKTLLIVRSRGYSSHSQTFLKSSKSRALRYDLLN